MMLKSFLFKIKDHRRKQGRRYPLGHLLLFSIFAILGGATSYRKIHAFIKANYKTLDDSLFLELEKVTRIHHPSSHHSRHLFG